MFLHLRSPHAPLPARLWACYAARCLCSFCRLAGCPLGEAVGSATLCRASGMRHVWPGTAGGKKRLRWS